MTARRMARVPPPRCPAGHAPPAVRRARLRPPPQRQRGIALLTAILLVALGTILAAAISYRNVMTARRSTAVFGFAHSLVVSESAEALAAYALQQDATKSGQTDYPGEPWARPFGPEQVAPGVTLQAQLEDLQGRFNLNSLVTADGATDPQSVLELQTLLNILGLEPKWAGLIADWIDSDTHPNTPDGAEDDVYTALVPAYRTANRPITSTSALLALPGFGRARYLRLEPYVTALPRGTKLNLCTAAGPVLDAMSAVPAIAPDGERQFSTDPQALAKNRANGGCFPTVAVYEASMTNPQVSAKIEDRVGVTSSWFRLTSITSIGSLQLTLYSLLYREPNHQVLPVLRTFTPD